MRQLVTKAELSAILTKELQALPDAGGSRISVQYALQEPDADGCNWSETVIVSVGPRATATYLTPLAAAIVRRARQRYNVGAEVKVTTTDETLVRDLNSAGLEGVRAEYRPTMAFDSAERVLEVVLQVASPTAGMLLAKWLQIRLQKPNARTSTTIVNQTTINAQNVAVVIEQAIERPADKKQDT